MFLGNSPHETQTDAETVVKVTIGRLDVRAVTEVMQQAQAAPEPIDSDSLKDYLRRRREARA